MSQFACSLCSVPFSSVQHLLDHVAGKKHRETLILKKSEELENFGRLHYLVENYLDDVPVLGLEYVQERQKDYIYRYTCTLCNKEEGWKDMVLHITSVGHMESFINKHHSELISWFRYFSKEEQLIAVTNAARTIPTKVGCGKKRISSPTVVANPPTQEAGIESDDLPSTGFDFLTEQGKKLPQYAEMMGEELDPTTGPPAKITCTVCRKSCSSLNMMWVHVQDGEHKEVLRCVAPEQVKDVGSVSHFLQCCMKDYPILGLEYIKVMGPGPHYLFSCQLCCLDSQLSKILRHIRGVLHPLSYIRKHHGNMLSDFQNCTKREDYVKALRDVALRILQRHGRKEFQLKMTSAIDVTKSECLPEDDGQRQKAVEDEGDVPPSKHDRLSGAHSQRRPSPYREASLDKSHESSSCNTMEENSNSDGSPSAKRGRLFPEGDQDALPSRPHTSECGGSSYNERMDFTTAEQELEFKTNDQFLQYLANFSIDDSEDAIFIQKITQNCIKALTSFRDEEIKRKKPSHQAEAP